MPPASGRVGFYGRSLDARAVPLVEQDARSAPSIADRAYVLEHGCIVREGAARELANDDDIRRVHLGM